MKTIDEKRLYDAIEATGEILTGSIHIIDQSDTNKSDGREGKFRIYHKNGYCFDVEKEYVCDDYEVSQFQDTWPDGFYYSFYQEWEGFKNDLTIDAAFELIKNNSHLPIR